ncbi:hypothetical protein DFH06DRAFT_1308268 [Mycena polygramma]|nr:hypothetical protein DFH06DRAFT_1308268 [Mycena polygramma]
MIFHDDLIPFQEFVHRHSDSPLLVAYIHAYCGSEYQQSRDYFYSTFRGFNLYQYYCTLWIRLSTGRLCVDPVQSETLNSFYVDALDLDPELNPPALTSLKAPGAESMVVTFLTLDQCHHICRLQERVARICVPTSVIVNLAAIMSWPSGSQLEEPARIASIPDAEIRPGRGRWRSWGTPGDVMENGWIRYHSRYVPLQIHLSLEYEMFRHWLSQANHIFTRLRIKSAFEGYGFVEEITFSVITSVATTSPPARYLFLCPVEDLQIGPSSYCWPACPAYWTLDPTGSARLSTEEAARLGLPMIKFETHIRFVYWDANVYAGLRKFYQGKGFNPDSQDLARHLGYELYQVTDDVEVPFAYATVEHRDFWSDDEDWSLGFAHHEPEDSPENNPKCEHTRAEEDPHLDGHAHTNDHELPAHDLPADYRASEGWDTRQGLQPVSSTFTCLMSVQLALILLAWLSAMVSNGVRE